VHLERAGGDLAGVVPAGTPEHDQPEDSEDGDRDEQAARSAAASRAVGVGHGRTVTRRYDVPDQGDPCASASRDLTVDVQSDVGSSAAPGAIVLVMLPPPSPLRGAARPVLDVVVPVHDEERDLELRGGRSPTLFSRRLVLCLHLWAEHEVRGRGVPRYPVTREYGSCTIC
jgi:hypothetical protein